MKISNAKEFGEEIRRRRKNLNYTQQFLSDFTGFSVSFISDLENGKATAELGKALHIANILGLDIELKERN
jgi:transcriptional regulator with XRE-family HTH domain